MSAQVFEAMPDDTAKLYALDNFRGVLMTIKIRKTVKFLSALMFYLHRKTQKMQQHVTKSRL